MDWFEREKKSLIQFYRRQKVVFVKGKGCWLYDENGKKYLDLVAGIAVVAIGHSNEKFVEKVSEQLKKLVHTSNLYYTIPQIKLAEKLKEITKMDKFFFCNSGTESVEAALKISRKVTGKKKFVAFENSFHGRTMGALSITYKEKFRKPFEPLLKPVEFAKFNDVEDLRSKVDNDTAAIIIEPVQGEAGVYVASKELIGEIFDLKDRYGFLVIFDEVQTGFGRTGKWFGKDNFGVQPDIMTMAKAMGNGFPIGCVGVKDSVAEKLEVSEHASTFGGNPLACTAALAAIEVIEEQNLVENSAKVGEYFKNRLNEIKFVENARGLGLMIGAKVNVDAEDVVKRALSSGLIVNNTDERNLRFVPPLILSKEEVDYAIDILSNLN
ncbi:aspartate aminotransferase family protein [Archaeoglobales archaeon]|nr:MAG: aspartate aminotransferase family protein [Archaeoglobales archaeon]